MRKKRRFYNGVRIDPELYERARFYRHLHIYLIVNSIIFFNALNDGDPPTWFPIAAIWGLGLLSHYRKVFDREPNRPQRSLDQERSDELDLVDDLPHQASANRERSWQECDLV